MSPLVMQGYLLTAIFCPPSHLPSTARQCLQRRGHLHTTNRRKIMDICIRHPIAGYTTIYTGTSQPIQPTHRLPITMASLLVDHIHRAMIGVTIMSWRHSYGISPQHTPNYTTMSGIPRGLHTGTPPKVKCPIRGCRDLASSTLGQRHQPAHMLTAFDLFYL